MANSKINFKNHFIELFVVIIGITIAFTLEGWSNRKKDKELERNYLNSIRADLLRDKEDLKTAIDSSKVLVGIIGETFQFTYSNADVKSYKRHHITAAYTPPYFHPKNGTYLSLINSGSLNLITDFDLKSSITSLYNIHYDEAERIDGVIKNLVDQLIYPYMIKNVTFAAMTNGITDAQPLRKNEAINMLGSYFNFINRRNGIYQGLIVQIDAVIERIDVEVQND